MTMNQHEPFEELMSASLSGDLTDVERQRLDLHLDECAACRDTLAAFAEQRRIMAGLRHVAPPRDLAARVRTGVERGAFAAVPWWRRPALLVGLGGSLAAVTGVLLAMVLLNGTPDQPPTGAVDSPSPTPAPTPTETALPSATEVPQFTLPPVVSDPTPSAPAESTPAPSAAATPTATPAPSAAASPTASPAPASPEPDVFLALTGPFDNLSLTVQRPTPDGADPDPIVEIEGPSGAPIAAELSPDGQWLAFITERGLSGLNEVRVTRISEGPDGVPASEETPIEVGETVVIGESVAGSPFLALMSWSPDGRYLAYTLADPAAAGFSSDVWLFQPEIAEYRPLTNVGSAYTAGWVPEADGMALWLSVADDTPTSYLLSFSEGEHAAAEPIDPADHEVASAEGVFQPLFSPNGTLAIYWTGLMTQEAEDGGWIMSAGGMPMLSEHDVRGRTYEFGNERPLFSDLTVDGDGFSSAAIVWGGDGDAYAVWNAQWTGESQGDEDTPYPDPQRVYFGHATDPRGLTRFHAIDEADLPAGTSVVDVKVSATGEHLLVTVRHPLDGDLSEPQADLLLIERNTGSEADVVRQIAWSDDGWFGPAAFDRDEENGLGE